jgi:putative membrane protein
MKTPMKTPDRSRKTLTGLALALFAAAMALPEAQALPKDTLNPVDVQFVKHEAAAGLGMVKIAELGVMKVQNADVKAFAEKLVADHSGANAELKQLAVDKGIDLSAVVDPADAKTFQDLEKVSGAAFDKAFLAAVVSAHKTCVDHFEAESKDAKNSDLKMWVDKMTPTLKSHLARAEELHSR